MSEIKTKQELATMLNTELPHFTGTSQYFRHPLYTFVYTDGVKYLAETAKAWWLLDLIASYQGNPAVRGMQYQFWNLKVDLEKETAVVTCVPDVGLAPIVTQEIEYTDFPLPEFDLWLATDVLYLPSEH